MSTQTISIFLICLNLGIIIIGLFTRSPEQYFGKEASPVTWISFFQLMLISFYTWQIFIARKEQVKADSKNIHYVLWLLISLGFLFLSIDEVARIHENMDSFFHKKLFHMKESAFSDRLDDMIIGFYAIIGISVLAIFKEELKKYYKAIPLLVISILLVFIMVVVELFANRFDIIPAIFQDIKMAKLVYKSCKVIEESLKLFAEASLVSTFYYCYEITKKNLIQK